VTPRAVGEPLTKLEAMVEPGHVDGGDPPPTRIEASDSLLTRPGPVPLDDDSWDAGSDWLNSDVTRHESARYHGRRRTKKTGSDYRWWIGGAAGLIASVATVALIMTPSSGAGGQASNASPGRESDAAAEASSTSEVPVGAGSATVGQPTGQAGTILPPFAVTIEAESGSPTVTLTGSAVVTADQKASGGQLVTGLGTRDAGVASGTLQISGISLPSAGKYRVAIYFANLDGNSSAVVSVTGAEPVTVHFVGTRKCCGERTIEVTLAGGTHALTITNATGLAPAIDKIVISRA
jgi:hypothetical protein